MRSPVAVLGGSDRGIVDSSGACGLRPDHQSRRPLLYQRPKSFPAEAGEHEAMITALRDTARQRYEQWFEAVMVNDTAALAELLDDDFIYTDIFGVVRYKAGYLAHVQRIPAGGITMDVGEVSAFDHGELTLVTGHYRVAGATDDGTDLSSQTRFTALWRDQEGVWRCLAHHATRRRDAAVG